MLAKVPKTCHPSTAQFRKNGRKMIGWRERIGRGLCIVTSVSKLNVTLMGHNLRLYALQRETKDAYWRRDTNNSSDTDLKRTHLHTNTPAGAAVPTESGWKDKCVLKARLKGSLKEERLWQKCVPRDFLFLLTLCVCVCEYIHMCVRYISIWASWPSSLTTYTGPDTHTMSGLLPTD